MLSRIATFLIILLLAGCLWGGLAALNESPVYASPAAQPATPTGQADLRINEFMADNVTVLQDPDEPGEFPDWIELYNGGPDPVSLDGLFLSDDPALPKKFAIPAGLSIASQGFMLFYADDDGKQGPQHLSFKLSATGEYIGLYGAKGATLLDSYTFGVQTPDIASGRQPDGSGPWRFLAKPTPGKSNAIPAPAILSVQRNPVQPEATTSVTVTAVIVNDGEIAATLYYSTGGNLQALPMVLIGGTTYQAAIPAQPDNTLVGYFIAAKNSANLTTTSPANAPSDVYRYMVGYHPPTLVINEVMADNQGILEDPTRPGEFPDWIELYNFGPITVSLDSLYLTDDIDKPTRFAIPAGLSIPPDQYLLFFADGTPEQGAQHTNFKLNRSGDFVGLYGAQGSFTIDSQAVGEQFPNLSFGRFPNGSGGWQILFCPTPEDVNVDCGNHISLPFIRR